MLNFTRGALKKKEPSKHPNFYNVILIIISKLCNNRESFSFERWEKIRYCNRIVMSGDSPRLRQEIVLRESHKAIILVRVSESG